MNELRSAVDAVLAENPRTLAGPELAGQLMVLRAQIDRLEAAFSARVAVFDARGDYADEGAANASVWLRHHCKLSPGDAASRVRVSRRLRDQLEETRDALAAAEVTYSQAKVIAEHGGRVADRLGEPGLVALKEAEPIFLQAAQRLHPNDLGKVVKRWEQVVDTDGFLTEHQRQFDRRFLNFSQGWDGMWHLDGVLDPGSGATLQAALQPLAAPAGPGDTREPRQRRADALVEVARRVLDSGSLPQTGGERRPARKPGGPRRGASAKRSFRRAPRRRAAWPDARRLCGDSHLDVRRGRLADGAGDVGWTLRARGRGDVERTLARRAVRPVLGQGNLGDRRGWEMLIGAGHGSERLQPTLAAPRIPVNGQVWRVFRRLRASPPG